MPACSVERDRRSSSLFRAKGASSLSPSPSIRRCYHHHLLRHNQRLSDRSSVSLLPLPSSLFARSVAQVVHLCLPFSLYLTIHSLIDRSVCATSPALSNDAYGFLSSLNDDDDDSSGVQRAEGERQRSWAPERDILCLVK
jgi:hypothetical protein